VLGGVGVSLARLLATADPATQFGSTVNADAAALYLGGPLYQDPEDGYSGILYGPFLPAVVSLLFQLSLWGGWPLLLTILATLAMVAVAAGLAHRPVTRAPGDRVLAVLEGLGIGALGWALAACIQLNGIFGGNGMHDQVAWALALGGVVLVPAASRGSRAATVGAVLLLTAGFWTKQNALLASVAAVGWLGLGAALGAVRARRAVAFAAALAGINAFLLGAVNLLTGGWEMFFNFVVPSRHPLGDLGDAPVPRLIPKYLLEDVLPATALALFVVGAVWLAVGAGAWLRARRGEGRSPLVPAGAAARRLGAELRRPAVVALPLVVTIAAAVWFRQAGAIDLYFLTAPEETVSRFMMTVAIPGLVLLALFSALLAVALAGREALRRRGRGASTGPATERAPWSLASLLMFLIAVVVPISFFFRQKIGADDNYYIGVAWALAFLAAIGWRRARAGIGTGLAAAGVLVAVFAAMVAVSPGAEEEDRLNSVNLPNLARTTTADQHDTWLTVFFPRPGLVPLNEPGSVLPELRAYARGHLVYSEGLGDINLRPQGVVWPNYDNFSGNLAAGQQPGYLLDAWLDRRFDAMTPPFNTDERKEQFVSGSGRWEENYLWKLNRVIRAGYQDSPTLPDELYERRPGPHAAPWMRTCFGPFAAAGTTWRINRGGGFWCRPPGTDRLELRDTPAPYTDVRTSEEVTGASGTLGVSGPARGAFEVTVEREDEPPLRLRGEPARGGGTRLTPYRGAQAGAPLTVPPAPGAPGGGLELALEPGGAASLEPSAAGAGRARVALPSIADGAVLRLGATRGSGVGFDLAGLRTTAAR